ncbi:MAG: hypothetical protein IBX52_12720, partial [Bacterioplanes sp.]|nr:hypothetical protein [Bacterioplanes sp.]
RAYADAGENWQLFRPSLANLLEQLRTRRNQNDLLTKKQTDLEKSHKALDSELSKAKKEIKVIREMGFTKMAWLKILQKL